MESFGFWYKLNSAQKGPDYLDQKKETLEQPTIDLHVNFWFLGDIPKHKTNQPYLDIGVQISQYKGLENIIFSFPFMLPDENIEDLAPKMSSKENASIVFNEECEIETKSEYTVVSIPDKDKLLIFPLDQAVEGIYNIEKYKGRSYIEIKFEQFEKYLKTNIELSDYNNIYIRFRIKETDLKNILYFDSEPFNKSLDSAFSGTRILDFKINEKRNIDKNIVARMDIQEEKLVKFDHVHFLVMEPASYDMISYTQNDMTCRELEKNLWNEYLDIKLDDKAGHVLAYHWRKKKKDGVRINDFSCFAKINYQKMQMKTVLAYVLVILGLGILGSSIVSATSLINIYFSWAVNTYMIQNFGMDLGLSFLMIFIGWCLGRAK